MSARGSYRSHSLQFKLQLCTDIRSGKIGRREAQREYRMSANLVQLWLTRYDRGELDAEEAAAATVTEYEARIAALERKVGQLTMELDLVKKRHDCVSRTTTKPRASSAARRLLRTEGVSNDRTAAQHLLLSLDRRSPRPG